jgi:hypothetical protein
MPSKNRHYVQRWLPPRRISQETHAQPSAPRIDALAIFGVLLLLGMILVLILGM